MLGFMKGFSLLELVIACALGLLLMAGIIESFAIVNRAMIHMDSVAALIEKGAFVERLIRADIQMAGFDACLERSVLVTPMVNVKGVLTLSRRDEHANLPCSAELIRRQYYVKKTRGDYSLYRKENHNNAIELVDGVSDFQVSINLNKVIVDFKVRQGEFLIPWHIEEYSREFQ